MKQFPGSFAWGLVCSLAAIAITPYTSAQDADSLEARLEAAMAADSRTEADRERDRNRKPLETLTFFGLRDDMKVVELIPGAGWYTKLLAPC